MEVSKLLWSFHRRRFCSDSSSNSNAVKVEFVFLRFHMVPSFLRSLNVFVSALKLFALCIMSDYASNTSNLCPSTHQRQEARAEHFYCLIVPFFSASIMIRKKAHKFQMNGRSLTMFFHQFWLLDLIVSAECVGACGFNTHCCKFSHESNSQTSDPNSLSRISVNFPAWESCKLYLENEAISIISTTPTLHSRMYSRKNFLIEIKFKFSFDWTLFIDSWTWTRSFFAHFPHYWLDNLHQQFHL